jgi:hypothetical protein
LSASIKPCGDSLVEYQKGVLKGLGI